MRKSVFISHAKQDLKVAMSICKALEARGHVCWIAHRDIAPGANYQGSIVRAIRSAAAMVMVFSAQANNSDEIKKELALASQQKLVVIPVRTEDVAPTEDYSYELATRQWIDLFDNWEEAIDRLARQIDIVSPRILIGIGSEDIESASTLSATHAAQSITTPNASLKTAANGSPAEHSKAASFFLFKNRIAFSAALFAAVMIAAIAFSTHWTNTNSTSAAAGPDITPANVDTARARESPKSPVSEGWGLPGLTVGDTIIEAKQKIANDGYVLASSEILKGTKSNSVSYGYYYIDPITGERNRFLLINPESGGNLAMRTATVYNNLAEGNAAYDSWSDKYQGTFGNIHHTDIDGSRISHFCASERVFMRLAFNPKFLELDFGSFENPSGWEECKGTVAKTEGFLFPKLPVRASNKP